MNIFIKLLNLSNLWVILILILSSSSQANLLNENKLNYKADLLFGNFNDQQNYLLAGIKVKLEPGDMLIYSGCDLEHWREEFKGKDCGQVFLHYNKANSKSAKENELDKRPLLGLPAWFKGQKLTNPKK